MSIDNNNQSGIAPQAENNAAANQEKFQKALVAAELKMASYTDIPVSLADELKAQLAQLQQLAMHIAEQESVIAHKNSIIIEKITTLKESPLFPEQADVRGIFEQAAHDYHALIKEAMEEMIEKCAFFQRHLGEGEKSIVISATCPEEKVHQEVAKRIEHEIGFLKSYIKRRKKELTVFFSRYEHGFAAHMQRLSNLELQIKYYSSQAK